VEPVKALVNCSNIACLEDSYYMNVKGRLNVLENVIVNNCIYVRDEIFNSFVSTFDEI